MYTKYEIKTYPDNPSNISQKNNYFQNKPKNYNYSDNSEKGSQPILETTFQPKCIFSKQNNNISFYQSSSKNSFKNSITKSKNQKELITPIMKTKNKVYTIKNHKEKNLEENTIQNFSYNYSDIIETNNKRNNRTIKNNINNININISPNTNNFNFNNNSQYITNKETTKEIDINNPIIKRNKRRPIKTLKKQYNVQKRDDFNVLSYKQPEEDDCKISNNFSTTNKNKIIKLYKKQVDEIFFPSKRSHSPSLPSKRKKNVLEKYQSQTLKYQKFYGSYTSNPKKMEKSFSKKKINQLNDFNIDKLIEIGDKYASMHPVLPLGKIMNNNILFFNTRIKKNKFQIPINTFNNCFNYSKYSKRTYNGHLEEDKENIPLFTNENRVTKKLITKNDLKNSFIISENGVGDSENKKISDENTVRKNLKFIKENRNRNTTNNYINTSGMNSNFVIRKRNINNNTGILRKQKSYDKSINENNLCESIPRRKFQKISCDLSMNNNNINSNYIIFNRNKLKAKEKSKERKDEKLLTEEVINNRNYRKNIIQKNNREILLDNNVNKRNSTYKYYRISENKEKNYYGYDDRHNLEDTINNHAYYESLHYKKV